MEKLQYETPKIIPLAKIMEFTQGSHSNNVDKDNTTTHDKGN